MKLLVFLLLMFLGKPVFAASQMEIFSDSAFTNPTTKFSAEQTVYVRIESDDPGETIREVKLKDNQYNDISTFQLSREGSGPFTYKVSFAVPETSGFYSIEATIASVGSQNKLVKTIQVGTLANVNTRINVRTQVKGTKSQTQAPTKTPQPQPTKEPTATSTATPQISEDVVTQPEETGEPSNFWQKVIQFFQSLFKFFFRF